MSRAPSRGVRALFALAVVLGTVVAAEVAGQLGYALLDRSRAGRLRSQPYLKPYEMPDPVHPGNWRLRPGLAWTVAETRKLVRDEGLLLAERTLERGVLRLGVRDDEVIFRTNAAGYKGPELDAAGARARVVAVGDSCTFGSLFDYYAWPRSAERALAAAGVAAEVVNAGVTGYSPVNALVRLDELRALRPRVAVIYIGWNALYGLRRDVEGEAFAVERLGRTLYTVWSMRGMSPQERALDFYRRPKRPDATAPELARLAELRPAFLADVEALARGLADGGARVFLATLPGLFVTNDAPNARALEIGHLPQFTQNPYVLAALAEGTNQGLRELATRLGVVLIDLDAWSRDALRPRDAWFIDSVHLTEEGQERIGVEVARAIAPALAAR